MLNITCSIDNKLFLSRIGIGLAIIGSILDVYRYHLMCCPICANMATVFKNISTIVLQYVIKTKKTLLHHLDLMA